jgi:hypothetical protein
MEQLLKLVAPMMPTLNLMITHLSRAHRLIAILQLELRTHHICEFLRECQMTDSMQSLPAILMADKSDCRGLVVHVHSQQIATYLIGEHVGLHNLAMSRIYMCLPVWEQVHLHAFA